MSLLFEISEVFQDWKPPFQKRTTQKEVRVQEKEGFEFTPKNTEPIFQVLENHNGRVLVEYRKDFTLKGYSQPRSKQVWLNTAETKEFSFLWGNNGITKKLTFKGQEPKPNPEPEPLPEKETTPIEEVVHTTPGAPEGNQQTLDGSKILESIETI
ncbi:hypothetical protein KKE06_05745 [Candidatus Micrarchaeota archaeon]|nr:hypothetical protein [Candidatus Micrarchaeota archaeon]MBU1930780.1 hypothetical protein [Candidatus Micrarchaeota archaeon]